MRKSGLAREKTLNQPEASKPSGRPRKVASENMSKGPQQSRVRSKKATTDPANTEAEAKAGIKEETTTKGTTQAQAVLTSKGASPTKTKPMPMKRVAFKDDTEQETQPLFKGVAVKVVQSPTSSRAKSIHKLEAATETSRGPNIKRKDEKADCRGPVKCLSPICCACTT